MVAIDADDGYAAQASHQGRAVVTEPLLLEGALEVGRAPHVVKDAVRKDVATGDPQPRLLGGGQECVEMTVEVGEVADAQRVSRGFGVGHVDLARVHRRSVRSLPRTWRSSSAKA